MFRKEYVFLQAEISPIIKVELSTTCKTYGPVSDRWNIFIKQTQTFIDFCYNFRTEKLTIIFIFRVMWSSSQKPCTWNTVRSANIFFNQLFEFLFIFEFIRVYKFSPSKSFMISKSLKILFPVINENSIILICLKYFHLILEAYNHCDMIELTVSQELLQIRSTVVWRNKKQISCLCIFYELFF